MTLNRRDLLKKSGTAGAGLAAVAASTKFAAPNIVRAQDTINLSVWKAPHTTEDQKFFDDPLATFIAESRD